jgi:hypothetical protein
LSIDRLLSKGIRKASEGDQGQDRKHDDQFKVPVVLTGNDREDSKYLNDAEKVLHVLY